MMAMQRIVMVVMVMCCQMLGVTYKLRSQRNYLATQN